MSRYKEQPVDLSGLKTVSLYARGGKVKVSDFATPHRAGASVSEWLDSLPRLLAADQLRSVAKVMVEARARGRAIIWGIGGHVIKCGLAPVLNHLISRGWITAIAMNGAASIHDFEIALAGHTSEDVEAVLPDGSFGSTEETGREMNTAISRGVSSGRGMGEALGEYLAAREHPAFETSVLACAYRAGVPVTVHVAVGCDTPHTHPAADGAAIGRGTHQDFRLFCSVAGGLHDGGVYVNAGSAVVLPEVFLKAVSAMRNLGHPLHDFYTANFDFLQHYRPRVNVVERPHAGGRGRGFHITGHHEILIPLLAAILIESEAPHA